MNRVEALVIPASLSQPMTLIEVAYGSPKVIRDVIGGYYQTKYFKAPLSCSMAVSSEPEDRKLPDNMRATLFTIVRQDTRFARELVFGDVALMGRPHYGSMRSVPARLQHQLMQSQALRIFVMRRRQVAWTEDTHTSTSWIDAYLRAEELARWPYVSRIDVRSLDFS